MLNKVVLPFEWKNERLFLLDQRSLPKEEIWVEIKNVEECYKAIFDMVVRGAPAIGFVGLWGIVLWCRDNPHPDYAEWKKICDWMKGARPTAVNLQFEIGQLYALGESLILNRKGDNLYEEAVKWTQRQIEQLYNHNLTMAKAAYDEMRSIYGDQPLHVMTHCNTGPLACGVPLGTALGVIFYLHQQKLLNHVWVDETRPYLQGSRLTSYELLQAQIPHHIVVDGSSSYLMRQGKVHAVFVGADRIALNGDTANKVGTSNLAIVANYYKIPFYVVAPLSSFDLSLSSGEEISIELRDEQEILSFQGRPIAHSNAKAYNPSFDITPGPLIRGIICEKGLIRSDKLKEVLL